MRKVARRIRPITNEREHKAALTEIERLWDSKLGSEEHDRFEVLTILVEKYEDETFPFDPPDPVEAILFRLDQLGMERSDLEAILGSRSRVSEVLRRKRDLSIAMISKLHSALKIPYESLMPRR